LSLEVVSSGALLLKCNFQRRLDAKKIFPSNSELEKRGLIEGTVTLKVLSSQIEERRKTGRRKPAVSRTNLIHSG
jgi:hypothetical protein